MILVKIYLGRFMSKTFSGKKGCYQHPNSKENILQIHTVVRNKKRKIHVINSGTYLRLVLRRFSSSSSASGILRANASASWLSDSSRRSRKRRNSRRVGKESPCSTASWRKHCRTSAGVSFLASAVRDGRAGREWTGLTKSVERGYPNANLVPWESSSVADPDPGSGAFLTPGSGMAKKSGSGSGMNNPDHISESLKTIFWVKILKIFDVDPGWKKVGSGSGINIPDPQHWNLFH